MKNLKLNSCIAAMLWVVVVVLSATQVSAQGFEFYYGGNAEDQGTAILQTDDRGYLIAGYSESFGLDNDLDVYLIRTDVDGQEIWSRIYDEGFIEHAYGMDATQDGGYIIVGDIRPTVLDSFDVYLLKIDRNGELLWSNNYGTDGFEQGQDVKATADGGYILVGRSLSQNGDLDILTMKVDGDGNLQWQQTFGGAGDDEGWSVEVVADGYIFGGNAVNPGNNSSDIYVFKLDFNGDLVWDHYVELPGTFEQGFGMTLSNDGAYVLAGHTENTFLLVKVSEDGQTDLWTQTISEGIGSQAYDVVQTLDGNYVAGGIKEVDPTNIDLFLAKVNATDGDPIWTHTYGRPLIVDWAESLIERADGGFALAGWNAQEDFLFINDVKLIKAGSDGRIRTNYITGTVYADWNNDLTQDPGEPGLNGWIIEATGNNGSWYGTTDADGRFHVLVDTGTYDLKVLVKGTNWEPAYPLIQNLSFPAFYDTIEAELPMHKLYTCPYLIVDVSTDAVVACEQSTFNVSYRNEGTATASGVEIRLDLDTDWTFVSATVAPSSQIGDSVYFFQVSDLDTGGEGSFEVTLNADCDAPVGANFFVQAHITPDDICVPTTIWDGSSIKITGTCEGDSVLFRMQNIGDDMIFGQVGYIVIEDEIMGLSTPYNLPAGMFMDVKRPANGSTWRIVSDQTPDHPGKSAPTVAVEGCIAGGGTNYSTGMVTMFPEDESNSFIAIDVQESVEAGAAIDLRAYPKGYRGDTIAANVDIEYHVRFENTTDDTLFWVAIRDSLPLQYLDLATIQPGAASHPYNFQAYDNGVVKFVFETIALPPASKGFVQFRISQQPDLPAGTEIFNKALLFVGYDEVPVESVQKRHVIGGSGLADFVEIVVSTNETPIPGVTVKVFPNPMHGQSFVIVEGKAFGQLEMNVYDAAGRLVRQERSAGNQITLNKGNLKAGTYFFVLNADGQPLKSGKVIVQ